MQVQFDRPLSDVETIILRGAWNGETYEEIAENSAYSPSYLRRNVGPKLWKGLSQALGEMVSKPNFRQALDRYRSANASSSNAIQAAATQATETQTAVPPVPSSSLEQEQAASTELETALSEPVSSHQDWGEALDVPLFVGRLVEQDTLKEWIIRDRCRLVLLLGMGGIGKTALSIQVGQQVQTEFDWVIWRSLRNAPPLLELLKGLIPFLANQPDIEIAPNADVSISQLLHYLRNQRCLLMLDNVEALLQAGDFQGRYRSGYEHYGQLFQRLAETTHQSCLVITSRELPQGLATHLAMSSS
ncbi:MAG: hypothetical protein F6K42_34670, partial [Leptolyngbya sp. SIO1D8]|nr:hypothetical protein [Leptolyngbya sp. SIO1D8]